MVINFMTTGKMLSILISFTYFVLNTCFNKHITTGPDYFNSIRDKKQIIFVTHNPLLVVNLDVDNVINVSKDRKNMISIQSGCIESSNMIDLLAYENPVFYTGF